MSATFVFQIIVSGLIRGSNYALLATSFAVIYTTTRTFHLAHALSYAVAGYVFIWTAQERHVPVGLAIPAMIAAAIAVGIGVERLLYRPLRRRGASQFGVFLASLGITTVGTNIIQLIFGPDQRVVTVFGTSTYTVSGITFTSHQLIEVIVSWAAIAALVVFLLMTKYGIAIRATRANEDVAFAVGVSLQRIYLLVFALGSALIALAALLALDAGATAVPTMGVSPVLTALIGVFFGGTSSVISAAGGGFAVGMFSGLSGLWLSGDYAPIVVFTLLFVVLIARPQGLFARS